MSLQLFPRITVVPAEFQGTFKQRVELYNKDTTEESEMRVSQIYIKQQQISRSWNAEPKRKPSYGFF